MARLTTEQMGLPLVSQLPALPEVDDSDIGGPTVLPIEQTPSRHGHPLAQELHRPFVDADCMKDPLLDSFYLDTWSTIAENNTKIYRAVFRCMPDSQVRNWDDYHQYLAYEHRFNELQGYDQGQGKKPAENAQDESGEKSGPPGSGATCSVAIDQMKTLAKNTGELNEKVEDLHGKIRGALHKRSDSEKAEANKAQLRAWAADANRAQAERAARDGQDLEKFPVLEEKTTISTLIDGRAANGTADRVTPSPSTTLAEKPTPPPQFVGYSEALNMNTQAIQVKRRRNSHD